MNTHPEINHLAKEERIRAIAYSIWEEEGCPDGRDEVHWTTACALVEAESMPRADEPEAVAATPEPDWLKREAAPERPVTLEQLAKRVAGYKAA